MDNEEDVLARQDTQNVDALFSKTQTIGEGEAASNWTFFSHDDLDVNVFNTLADQVERDQGSNELLLQSVEEEVFEPGHIWYFGLFSFQKLSSFLQISFFLENLGGHHLYMYIFLRVCACVCLCVRHTFGFQWSPPCVFLWPPPCVFLYSNPSIRFCVPP